MRAFFRRNMGLKLLSLALAFILWASVVTQSPEVRLYEIPVRFVTGPDRIVTNPGPTTVGIQLVGSATILDRLAADELYAEVDVSHLPPGSHRVAVVAEEVKRVPRGIASIDVVSGVVSVRLDARKTALLPVKVTLTGKLAEGYELVRASAKPSDVEVSGPEKDVTPLKVVPTEPLDLSELTETTEKMLKVALPEANVRPAPTTVLARAEIREVPIPMELTLPVQPTEAGWTVEPGNVKLTVQAPPSLTDRLRQQLRAIAQVEGVPDKGREVAVTLSWGDLETEEMARLIEPKIEPAKVRVKPR